MLVSHIGQIVGAGDIVPEPFGRKILDVLEWLLNDTTTSLAAVKGSHFFLQGVDGSTYLKFFSAEANPSDVRAKAATDFILKVKNLSYI